MPDEALGDSARRLGDSARRLGDRAGAAGAKGPGGAGGLGNGEEPAGGSGMASRGLSGVGYLVSVGFGDLALLLGPVGRGSGLGTRLFNLKSTELNKVA